MPNEERSLGAGPGRVNAGKPWQELALCLGSVASDASGREGPTRLATFAVEHLRAARAVIFGRKPEPGTFPVLGSAGLDKLSERAAILEYGRRLAGWVERTRGPLVVQNPSQDVRFEPSPTGLTAALALPLKSETEFLGAFVVFDEGKRTPLAGEPSDSEREVLLVCLAQLTAMSVDRARARSRWRELALDLEHNERRMMDVDRRLAAGELKDELLREIMDALHGIGGLTDQVLGTLDSDDARRAILERLAEETSRLARAMAGSAEMARSAPRVEPDTLNRIMSETLSVVREEVLESRVQLTQRLGASLPPLLLDADLMRRVFLNLVRAGIQSANFGGRVKVETKRRGDVIEVMVAADGERRPGQSLDAMWAVFGDDDGSGGLRLGLSRHLLLDRGITLRTGTSREWPFCLSLIVPIARN
ncbi:MAG TPA: GAF domain-containing protein, partial [Candidatus Eisenbacteria bacterium]|nr:GAF domain-containing protein [Candidatus Eisenbacteria bacterium]